MKDQGEMDSAGMPGRPGQIAVRVAGLNDLPQLMAISQAAAFSARWTEQQWRDIFLTQITPRLAWIAWESVRVPGEISGGANGVSDLIHAADAGPPAAGPSLSAAGAVTRSRPRPASSAAVGFLVAQCGGPEWELENMAVLPAFRRRGVGSALLAVLLAEARARQAERILLEVRPSNLPAIRLYGQGGFQRLARRPGYYREPVEDALVM